MSAVAVIQARMTSSRFPGKVMRLLAGRPLLWHIATRVACAREVAQIVVACTDRDEDDVIVEFCRQQGLAFVRGPENNVLERFRMAKASHEADVYVRICGDSPLVAPDWIDRCVQTLRDNRGDYTAVRAGQMCAHEGVDVMSRHGLELLLTEAAGDRVAQEHITGYFKANPHVARVAEVDVPEEERIHLRLSVDVPEDLEFFERLYARSKVEAGRLSVRHALNVLRDDPSISAINSGVRQRTATERPKTILLYGEGGGGIGWGHLSRLEVLGGALRRAGANVVFCYEGTSEVAPFLERSGLPGRPFLGGSGRGSWLAAELAATDASGIVIDTCGNLTASDLIPVRAGGRAVILIDDTSERTRFAHAVLNPPAPQALTPPPYFKGDWQAGWDWVPLREEFLRELPEPTPRTLLVTMGGSDPGDFTARALAALDRIALLSDWSIRVVLGRSYPFRARLAEQLARSRLQLHIIDNSREMARELAGAQAVLLSFGVTAYEAAAVGRPMACFCLSEDHRRHAEAFSARNLAMVLDDDPADDAAKIERWLGQLSIPAAGAETRMLRQGTRNLVQKILEKAGHS